MLSENWQQEWAGMGPGPIDVACHRGLTTEIMNNDTNLPGISAGTKRDPVGQKHEQIAQRWARGFESAQFPIQRLKLPTVKCYLSK